ncbi:MAG: DUF934 domain-containing protein [Pseudomonadota bacterium]
MSIIIRDDGFHPDNWEKDGGSFADLEKFGKDVAQNRADKVCIDVPNNTDAQSLYENFDNAAMIRIAFPSFADGRGFSLAKQLRQLGYEGRLRAFGHVIADQYGFARVCGFDEIEIDDELAKRQPETQWLARIPKLQASYQHRLLGEQVNQNV